MSDSENPQNNCGSHMLVTEAVLDLCRDLIGSGFATVDQIAGCTTEEVAEVISSAPDGFPIPDEYLAFLEKLGRGAGSFFMGTDLFFPSLLEANEAAADISSGPAEALTLQNRFFIGHHQGYKVYYFDLGSEAVYAYQEGLPETQRLANSFVDFLRQAFEIQKGGPRDRTNMP
ncbi:SMI1/KNR4 family protein [Nocardia sp. CS682]|uniref:SMI1/KNR4 family protein n=1 Tax=Nocardia sp. CS682 TaxID=1047172 RepID=UPI0010751BB6|nr:SMI1/KNR4 family protein [Nocardia sp. CS682]QBS42925.1 SMI1/KNR4 family protein [Nocardia sp. CS682]